MINKLILGAIFLLGGITALCGAIQYTTPYAAADAIVDVVRNSPPDDQYSKVEEMLNQQHLLFILWPTITGSLVMICASAVFLKK